VLIPKRLLAQIVDHARRDHPNECCGLVATADGRAVAVHEAANAARSPYRFEIDGQELYDTTTAIEDAGHDIGAIYHSHTRSDPYPSQTDVNFAANWPGLEWIIVGTAGAEPVVRSYRIDDGRIAEVEVVVEDV
jgi:proteasome lid subunit RPN8/RPN11